jgi:hypothetical protein
MAYDDEFDDEDVANALGQGHKKSKRPFIHPSMVTEMNADEIDSDPDNWDDDSDGD